MRQTDVTSMRDAFINTKKIQKVNRDSRVNTQSLLKCGGENEWKRYTFQFNCVPRINSSFKTVEHSVVIFFTLGSFTFSPNHFLTSHTDKFTASFILHKYIHLLKRALSPTRCCMHTHISLWLWWLCDLNTFSFRPFFLTDWENPFSQLSPLFIVSEFVILKIKLESRSQPRVLVPFSLTQEELA